MLTDELWQRLEPLLPVRQRRFRYPGRLRTPDRAALEGILFVARTGISWNDLPTALFGASGATCWRRLKQWYEAGSGSSCTSWSWPNCAPRAGWICPRRSWTPVTCGRSEAEPHRSQPGRPGPAGQQAPPDHRRRRDPFACDADRWAPQRCHPASHRSVVWSGIPCADLTGSTPTVLRPRQVPADAAPGPDHPAHRPSRRCTRIWSGCAPLVRRADHRLAAWLQTPTRALRTPRRHPPRADQPCLLSDLPPPTHSELSSSERPETGVPSRPVRRWFISSGLAILEGSTMDDAGLRRSETPTPIGGPARSRLST